MSDVYPQQTLFDDKLQLDPVEQGNLGEGYFLVALAGITSQPKRIKRLFMSPTDKVNAVGIYQVQFYLNGRFQSVVVDDYVPVDKDSG